MRTYIGAIAALLGALGSLGGCGPTAPRRAMAVEIKAKDGLWRLQGVAAATLDLADWQVSVTDTAISDWQKIPYLERFTLAIVNTSRDRKLYLEPREIFLTGVDRRALWLGPSKPVTLEPGKRISLIYDKGIRGPALLYPFAITITVFRGPEASESRKAVLLLY